MIRKTDFEWENMVRGVVAATAAEQQRDVCQFLTGLNLSKENFAAEPAAAWKHELFWVGELCTSSQVLLDNKMAGLSRDLHKQPALLDNKQAGFTQEHLQNIGQMCAVHVLFNTMDGLAEQVAISGGQVVSLLESVNALPEGLSRIIYTEKVRELVEKCFSADTATALKAIREPFHWGTAKFSDEQMSHILAGMRQGFQAIARQPITHETLTKPTQKAFAGVLVDVGLYDLQDMMNFLSDVQEEIKKEASSDGKLPARGMCGALSK